MCDVTVRTGYVLNIPRHCIVRSSCANARGSYDPSKKLYFCLKTNITYDSLRHVLTPSIFQGNTSDLLETATWQFVISMRRYQLTRDKNKQNVLSYLRALVNHKLYFFEKLYCFSLGVPRIWSYSFKKKS